MDLTAIIRDELDKKLHMLRTLLEDVERRRDQGVPAALTAVAFRAVATEAQAALELAGELRGRDPS